MKKSRYTEEQMIGVLKQMEAGRADVTAIRAEYPLSERQAGLIGIAASSFRYRTQAPDRDEAQRARLTTIAQRYPRFGSPRLCSMLRREAVHNHNRAERIYREAGLSLRRKKRKRFAQGLFGSTTRETSLSLGADTAVSTTRAVTFLTDAPLLGRQLSAATGFGAEELALHSASPGARLLFAAPDSQRSPQRNAQNRNGA